MRARLAGLTMLMPIMMAAGRGPVERIVTGEALVSAWVNGEAVTLRIDPAAPAMPLIDARVAEKAGLKMTGSWGVGIGYSVGGTSVMSRTQVVQLDLGAGPVRRRVGWTSRPFAAVADGSVGPGAFPEPIIRFVLRKPVAGETTVSLPMERDTALGMFGNFSATYGRIIVGGEPMRVRFDPYHARSLVTSGAGARLSDAYGGGVSGDAVSTEIFFGIRRPVRALTLKRPLQIGAVSISTLGIRTAGETRRIGDAGADDTRVDPDEIVVTARGKKRETRRDTLSLGADHLSRCSSIVFDRDAGVIRLSCA